MAKNNSVVHLSFLFDNDGKIPKALKQMEVDAKGLKKEFKDADKTLKEMLANAAKYDKEAIAAQIQAKNTAKARFEMQKKLIAEGYTDLSALRKAATQMETMDLRALQKAMKEANARMKDMGGIKRTKEETMALADLMNKIKLRIDGIQKGFNNLWDAATSGAKMSVKQMEELVAIIDKEGSSIAKNEQHYQQLMNMRQKMQTQIAGFKGFDVLEDKLKNGKVASVTNAQLSEYKKFYDGIVKNAWSSAKEVSEAMDKIKLANRAINEKEGSQASDIAYRVNKGTFDGSVSDKEEAIKKLQEYRKNMQTGDDGANEIYFTNIDKAINKLRADLDKVKESTVLAKTELKNLYKVTTGADGKPQEIVNTDFAKGKSLEDLKRLREAMEEYKRSLKSTDTKGLKNVQQALVEIDKAESRIKASAIDWSKFSGGELQKRSLSELKQAYSVLEEKIKHVARNQDEWNKTAAQMRDIDSQIKNINNSIKAQSDFWDKAQRKLVNYVGIYLSFNAIMNKTMQAWQNIVKLSDQMTNVQKVTGMTADEVQKMTDAIQGLDTRTANEELMALAEQAGKLGYNTSDAITQFVKAGQVITNTLGDIGGAESITELLKISDLVNKNEAMDVEESLNRVGSAVLNIGNNSKASYSQVTEFTKRLGAVGAQSKMSMPEIMAFAGTFGALGGNVEASSTALQRVIIGLQTRTKEVAMATNTSLSDLMNALTADAEGKVHVFEALELVLTNIREEGISGVDKFLQAIGGRNSQESKKSMSLLIENLDSLDEMLKLAQEGYEDGTIATQEFEKANNNLAGVVAQIGNEFYEMGAKASMTNGPLKSMASAFLSFVRFIKNSNGLIRTLNGLILAFAAAMTTKFIVSVRAGNKYIAQTDGTMKALGKTFINLTRYILRMEKDTTALRASFSQLWKVASGPIIGVIVTAIGALATKLMEAKEETKELNQAVGEYKEAASAELATLERLKSAIEKANEATGERKAAIEAFNKTFKPYLSNVLTEKNVLEQLRVAYDEVAAAIYRKTAAQIKETADLKSYEKYETQINQASGELSQAGEQFGINRVFDKDKKTGKVTNRMGRYDSKRLTEFESGLTEIKSEILKEVTSDNQVNSDKLFRRIAYLYQADFRFNRQSINNKGEVRSESIFNDKNFKDKLIAYIDVKKKERTMASSAYREADVMTNTAENFDIDRYKELRGQIGKQEKKFDRRRTYEQMFKIWSNVSDEKKDEAVRNAFEQDKANYNKLIADMKPWGTGSSDWSNMGGQELADIVDWYNEVQKKYKNGVLDGSHFMETFGAMVPNGVKLPESMENWNHDNLISWAYQGWQDAKAALKKWNKANPNGDFKDFNDKSGRSKREGDELIDGAMHRLDEFYKRQEEIINLSDTTDAQRERDLTAKRKEWRQERQNLIDKFFDKTKQFDHDYITELFTDITNDDWTKTNTFLADRKNMDKAENLRLTKAKDANQIATDANALAKKVQDILGKENPFTKMWEKNKSDLDILDILLPGLGKDEKGNYKDLEGEIQDRMSFLYSVMSKAAEMSSKEFREKMKSFADPIALGRNDVNVDITDGFESIVSWGDALSDEQMEQLRSRMEEFYKSWRKFARRDLKEIMKEFDESWAESGDFTNWSKKEENLEKRQKRASALEQASGADNMNVFGHKGGRKTSDQLELDMYKLKIEKELTYRNARLETIDKIISATKKQYDEALKLENAAQQKLDNSSTEEEAQKAREELAAARAQKLEAQEEGDRLTFAKQKEVEEKEEEINKLTNDYVEKASDLAMQQVEKFRPYADMVNQFAEDFGANIFGKKEDRQKAAKALLTSFVKTTGMMLAHHLTYLATKRAADNAATVTDLSRSGAEGIADVNVQNAKGIAKEVGKSGWIGFAKGAAITAGMTLLIAMITSAINKAKSEVGGSTGRLATGMLTYANGLYPTYEGGTVGGMQKVQGNDGKTYNATYKPNLTTGEYSRPHLGIVGEKGAELIIDHPTYSLLRKKAPGILQGIYDMHRYGRLALDYESIMSSASYLRGNRALLPSRHGVRTYAAGNVESALSDIASNASDAGSTASQNNNDRLADVLERLMQNGIQAKINMYGKDELYESMQKANRFMKGRG